MGMFKKDGDGRKFDRGGVMLTVIGPEAYFHGVLTVRGSLRIEGEVEGNVQEANEVTVGTNGKVRGDICAELVTVSGSVEGAITASKQLEIKEGGKVSGDIRTGKLLIEEGAVFEGNCAMSAGLEASKADGPAKEEEGGADEENEEESETVEGREKLKS